MSVFVFQNNWLVFFIEPFLFLLLFCVRLPDVYTQFRKAVETQSRVRPLIVSPDQLRPLPPGLEEGALPTLEDLGQSGKNLAPMASSYLHHNLLVCTTLHYIDASSFQVSSHIVEIGRKKSPASHMFIIPTSPYAGTHFFITSCGLLQHFIYLFICQFFLLP